MGTFAVFVDGKVVKGVFAPVSSTDSTGSFTTLEDTTDATPTNSTDSLTTTPTVVATPTVETVKPQKTWTHNGVVYTAKELEAAMADATNGISLKIKFKTAVKKDPSLQGRFNRETNVSGKIDEELKQSTAALEKAESDAEIARNAAQAAKKLTKIIKGQ